MQFTVLAFLQLCTLAITAPQSVVPASDFFVTFATTDSAGLTTATTHTGYMWTHTTTYTSDSEPVTETLASYHVPIIHWDTVTSTSTPTVTTTLATTLATTVTSATSPAVATSMDTTAYEVAEMPRDDVLGERQEAPNICTVSAKFIWEDFDIRGMIYAGSSFDEIGNKLKGHIEKCQALTKWSYEALTNDPDGYQWHASGRVPLGGGACVNNDALGDAGGVKNCN